MTPRFSIIIPSHNGADRIGKAIRSCLEQSYPNYEVIVVCDACDDNTQRVAESYGVKVISVDVHNDGLARNAGIDVASGEWILFLDDDDWWLHEYVFKMLSDVIDSAGDCDAIFFSFIKRGVGYIKQTATYCDPLSAGHLWRRDFIGTTRHGNESYGSDNAFFYKLISKNPEVVFVNQPMYYYNYMRDGSMSDRHKRGEI